MAFDGSARHREICSMAGKIAHARGKAHTFTKEEARKAGRKGGAILAQNRDYMREIGIKGAQASKIARQKKREESNKNQMKLPIQEESTQTSE